MKILLTGWGFPPKIEGGLDIHVYHLFEELEKRDDVDVKLALPENYASERENIISIPVGEGAMTEQARIFSQEVAKLDGDFDIIHTHDWFGAETGFKHQKYRKSKWISTIHSLDSDRSRIPSDEIKRLEKVAVQQPDKVVAVSERLGEKIRTEYERKPEIVHNGFSTPSSSGFSPREKFDIEGEMIFFVGRHSEQKGIEYLIYGFHKFLEDKNATLVIGGEGYLTKSLQQFVEMLDIKESVVFTGFIPKDRLGDYYREADVFVSPSISEPFGLTITEALESNTPVVATSSGVEEVASSIISVEPKSESIKNGIFKALDVKNPSYSSRSWNKMTEELFEIYDAL